uniref:Uncharacterized protein n=1 Tax=Glossina pallidipes TaxID=7398 RepID=A0A1A9ZJU1_GLOPL
MTSIQELIKSQTTTGDIQRVIRNYKKDSADRKSKASYYHDKRRIISELAFETTDGKLRILVQTNIEYFDKAGQLKEAEVLEQAQRQGILPSVGPGANTLAINKSGHGLIGRFNARSTALKRFLAGLENVGPNEPQKFYTVRIDTINKLWGQVENLYVRIWEQVSDPLINGLDQDNHDEIQSMLTELATIQGKLEVMQTARIQHHDSPNHDFKVACSALIISIVAIIIISCSMIFLKKSVIAQITVASNHDAPQHEAAPSSARTSHSFVPNMNLF